MNAIAFKNVDAQIMDGDVAQTFAGFVIITNEVPPMELGARSLILDGNGTDFETAAKVVITNVADPELAPAFHLRLCVVAPYGIC